METRKGLFYTKEHEWLRLEGGRATVGLTAYALNALGEVTYLELVEPGESVEKGGRLGTVESVKTASDIFCPVPGRVVTVNEEALGAPEKLNESPYDDGWLAVIETGEEGVEKAGLLSAEQYEEFIAGLS